MQIIEYQIQKYKRIILPFLI